MAKKISEKTSGISLAGFQPRASSAVPQAPGVSTPSADRTAPREPGKSFTGAGIFMSAITGKDELAKELSQVQAKLASVTKDAERFEGADVVRSLDPNSVKCSHWANRSEESFQSTDYGKLKLEIENAGGNVQPIKVRPIVATPGSFEIVYGHRRHRACLELGLQVRALIEDLSDVDLFAQMDRENRQRADLRPYEQGRMYAMALDEGLFPSLRKMADALGVDASNASKAISLAKLPAPVLASFQSPLDLRQAWATPLASALQKNPDLVLTRARALSNLTPKLPSAKVFQELTAEGVVSNHTLIPAPIHIKGKAGKSAKVNFNSRTGDFEISLSGLDATHLKIIQEAVKSLVD